VSILGAVFLGILGLNLADKMKELIKFFKEHSTIFYIIFALFQYALFLILIYQFNIFWLSTNYPATAALISIFIACIYILLGVNNLTDNQIFSVGKSDIKVMVDFYIWFRLLIELVLLVFFLIYIFTHFSLITNIFIILGVIGILAILYVQFKPSINKILEEYNKPGSSSTFTKILSLAWMIVMYIPCLLVALVEYLKLQYKITTKPVWLLLGGELLLVVFWVILPWIYNKIVKHDGDHLLEGPIYLNDSVILRGLTAPPPIVPTSKKATPKQNNYALSAWFYINEPTLPPDTYFNILDYANKSTVTYNPGKNILKVQATNMTATPKKLTSILSTAVTDNTFYLQKWNNIVINYDGATMDVFLNAVLVASAPNILINNTQSAVTLGENKGVRGGICNVVYYNHVLTERTVAVFYKLLRDKNPPVL
jgi:hypothetical protein